jgi:uncharacterized protein YndB with AHSA1/START domain
MTNTGTATALLIRRTFKASRARVFDAWTKPELLRQWFGPAGMTTPEVALDLREGGAYRIVILDSDGDKNVAVGTFTKVRRPEQLSYTWSWENDDPSVEGATGPQTQVTIDFIERGDETEMVFKQEGFATVESRDGHDRGWTTTFDKLAAFLGDATAR